MPHMVQHVVVDGSNIATEGRSLPSLAQLDEAVKAFLADHPVDKLTVVVDATFGHRIDASERPAYEEAVLAGELVSPPAGAIGRGDAFVLQIADKAGAAVLSNDSFQEFHGQYPWLFEEGRLIGGKPVPDVGWVFVKRAPVRGPVSRRSSQVTKATRAAKAAKSAKAAAKAAQVTAESAASGNEDSSGEGAATATATAVAAGEAANVAANGSHTAIGGEAVVPTGRSRRRRGRTKPEAINEPMAFIDFVAAHPVGSPVEATVERFSSHGAYVTMGDARGYVSLKSMADPPPRSAREVLKLGDTKTFVVERYDPPRRGIDLAVPGMAQPVEAAPAPSDAELNEVGLNEADEAEVLPEADEVVRPGDVTDSQPDQESTVMAAPKKTGARKAATKKSPRQRAVVKKAGTKRATKSPAKKAARRATTSKSGAKKSTAKKSTAKKSTAKRSTASKTTAKRGTRKTTTKKSPTRKTAAKKSPAKKSTAKRSTTKR